ncbi:hypothetical protein OROMI_009877 [Orobanche minor]
MKENPSDIISSFRESGRFHLLFKGKSNVITKVAKSIKEHFQRHLLAIVSIKGRAKGTSVREVIYNLEICIRIRLYQWLGSGIAPEPDQASRREVKPRPLVSPELISAMRLECGLTSPVQERALPDDIPSNN